MRRRFARLDNEHKGVLRSVKRLYQAGVYKGREEFSRDHIKAVAGKFEETEQKAHWWNGCLDELASKGFCNSTKDGVHFEEAYLLEVVDSDFRAVGDFKQQAELFPDDPDALFSIAWQAYEIAQIDLGKASYLRFTIDALHKVLKHWTLKSDRQRFAMTQNNLGTAYSTLSEVESKVDNCRKAITAYEKSLRVYTYEKFPIQYGMTQNNLGVAYWTLAEAEAKQENCCNASRCFQDALRVYQEQGFPLDDVEANIANLSEFCDDTGETDGG